MTDNIARLDVDLVQKRLMEARALLIELDLPIAQQNERSALTLLTLLGLTPDMDWEQATNPLCGVTPMMDFFAKHYGKQYKPNTRETVRRQSIHQFLDAGLIVANPDKPTRPITSPKTVYQIHSAVLATLRLYGSSQWTQALRSHFETIKGLRQRYAQEREIQRLPVVLPSGVTIQLSPGGQNVLVKQILDDFAARFTPGGEIIYIGDTDAKFAFFAESRLQELGVVIDAHGKMPDVVIYYVARQWLILIEAVTSHGPIDPKRRGELAYLFRNSNVGLVYVTAFLDRKTMSKYLSVLSWSTEVWLANAPDHLIHFNGDRFLGPYDTDSYKMSG
jgi:BsuBI/PstI restriction endonuclease domain/BsuBI/PstI restriction endonuclease HTH domain